MIRNRSFGVILIMGVLLLLVLPATALPSTTVDLTLEPDEKGGEYLPALESDAIDVKVTSNVPVDVYIVTNDQVTDATTKDDFEYEKKWESRTSLDVDYTVEDQDKLYFIMVHNTDDTETANVELEYKIYEEIAEEAAKDAAEEICCLGTMVFITIALIASVGIASVIRSVRRQ